MKSFAICGCRPALRESIFFLAQADMEASINQLYATTSCLVPKQPDISASHKCNPVIKTIMKWKTLVNISQQIP